MANWNEPRSMQEQEQAFTGASVPRSGTVFDAGLRKHMLSIYNYMTSGILLTGLVALLAAESGLVYSLLADQCFG